MAKHVAQYLCEFRSHVAWREVAACGALEQVEQRMDATPEDRDAAASDRAPVVDTGAGLVSGRRGLEPPRTDDKSRCLMGHGSRMCLGQEFRASAGKGGRLKREFSIQDRLKRNSYVYRLWTDWDGPYRTKRE